MQTTSVSHSTRKATMLAIAVSFVLGTAGHALAQEYDMPEVQEEEQEQEQQEAPEMSREELLEQQAREALDENQPADYSAHSLADMLGAETYFSNFHQALEQTGLLADLEPDQQYTVFAPFDEALSRLPEGVWENWTQGNNSEEFREFIAYHVVEGSVSAEDLSDDAESFTTLNGDTVELRSAYGAIMVNQISVNMPDIETNQGYVHGIDSVLGDLTQLEAQASEDDDSR